MRNFGHSLSGATRFGYGLAGLDDYVTDYVSTRAPSNNAWLYLQQNPDLLAAVQGQNTEWTRKYAVWHYENHGRNEGRTWPAGEVIGHIVPDLPPTTQTTHPIAPPGTTGTPTTQMPPMYTPPNTATTLEATDGKIFGLSPAILLIGGAAAFFLLGKGK